MPKVNFQTQKNKNHLPALILKFLTTTPNLTSNFETHKNVGDNFYFVYKQVVGFFLCTEIANFGQICPPEIEHNFFIKNFGFVKFIFWGICTQPLHFFYLCTQPLPFFLLGTQPLHFFSFYTQPLPFFLVCKNFAPLVFVFFQLSRLFFLRYTFFNFVAHL